MGTRNRHTATVVPELGSRQRRQCMQLPSPRRSMQAHSLAALVALFFAAAAVFQGAGATASVEAIIGESLTGSVTESLLHMPSECAGGTTCTAEGTVTGGFMTSQNQSQISTGNGVAAQPGSDTETVVAAAAVADHTAAIYELSQSLASHLSVLWVLDPNFRLCHEAVPVNPLTRGTILSWAAELRDALKAHAGEPYGPYLEVDSSSLRTPAGQTYKEYIAEALAKDDREQLGNTTVHLPSALIAAYEMTMLPTTINATKGGSLQWWLPQNKLRFTTTHTFWSSVELTAWRDALGGPRAPIGSDEDTSTFQILGLEGTTVFLPRWIPMVHSYEYKSLSHGEARHWKPDYVVNMVDRFVRTARMRTVPSIAEWRTNGDKKALHKMYKDYYDQDPENRTPPLETVFLKAPLRDVEADQLCLTDAFQPTEKLVEATMQRIFEGIQALHKEAPGGSQGQLLAGPERDGMRAYTLKREYSEASGSLKFFKFPTPLLQEPHSREPWLARTPLQFVKGAADSSQDVRTDMVATKHLLRDAALHLLHYGCTEGWLLQFTIPDFSSSEYRVFFYGGANAPDEDVHVVYTAATLAPQPPKTPPPASVTTEDGVEVPSNSTEELDTLDPLFQIQLSATHIPKGRFQHELVQHWTSFAQGRERIASATDAAGELPPGPLRNRLADDILQLAVQAPWPSPKMYKMLFDAARSGASALAAGRARDGSPLRTLQDVHIRMDVLLALVWNNTSNRLEPIARINEMDWLNSGANMINVWKPITEQPDIYDVAAANAAQAAGQLAVHPPTAAQPPPAVQDLSSRQGLVKAFQQQQGSSRGAAWSHALLRRAATVALGEFLVKH
mmetsp:Transcript_3835/g.11075  ORF Transcript_3835/g.11075 Transcript_3835/m.11075 type:complete len:845 (+) Transcript_3835:571-3105(+)